MYPSQPQRRLCSSPARERVGASLGGEVVGLFTSPRSAAPMQSHHAVELVAGSGIAGDRYALLTGSYSALKFSAREPGTREPGRQLTIISADSIDAALAGRGLASTTAVGWAYGDFRRNVVVRGVSAEELLAAQGSELCLGPTCRIFVHRHCVPCFYNEKLCGRAGQLEAIFDASGCSCEVVVGGPLRVGASVTAAGSATRTDIVRDVGTQPPGYYVRPSKRTAAMNRGASVHMARALDVLMQTDVAGAERAQAAYESVGLSFWPTSSWKAAKAKTRGRRVSIATRALLMTAVVATSAGLAVAWLLARARA